MQRQKEQEVSEIEHEIEKKQQMIDHQQQEISELTANIENSNSAVSQLKKEIQINEKLLGELKKENKALISDRDQLLSIGDRKDEQIQRLEKEIKAIEQILQNNISSKCEALAKLDSSSSFSNSSEIENNFIEQENHLLKTQIESFKLATERNVNELATVRNETSLKIISVENKLIEKIEELKSCKLLVNQLEKTNNDLQVKLDDLAIKTRTDSEANKKMIDHYERELQSQKKLADLRKENSEENEKQVGRLTCTIKELQMLLHEVSEDYGAIETKLKNFKAKSQGELHEKENNIQRLTEELANANQLLKVSKEDSFENVFECVAQNQKFCQNGSIRITELYSSYVKISEELILQKKENDKLKFNLKKILDEIESRAPVLQKQAYEYQFILDENTQLKQQLKNTNVDIVDHQREYDNLTLKINYLQRENLKLKTQKGDLNQQICHLLQEIERSHTSQLNLDIAPDMSASEVISKKVIFYP